MMIIDPYRYGSGGGSVDPTALAIYNKIVAWWEHDETSGTTMVDKHGGRNGTYSGSITLNQSALASGLAPCARFTANTSAGVVPQDAALNFGTTYAVMVWFKRDGVQAANAKIIVRPTDVPNGRATYYLQYTNASGKLLARFNSGSSYYDITGATTIADATTYQAIFNKNTTGSDLYVNNALDGSQASGGTPDTSSNSVYHGEMAGSDGFIGYYSATAGFSAPLDSTERTYLYNSGNGISYAALKAAAGL